eukprot:TRINITY_DN9983_c0_g1_i1.p1 TRINITY_DN9983_c0_g1~~TRINITY_DN9983_c0_g1_i1.p1  ORF type:complete len:107 (-),score=17.97 TRINITY_DN9983_c0_g1_i1:22-342(-)
MFGCCPACVKYGGYGDICPGVQWEEQGNQAIPGNIAFGDDLSTDPNAYPLSFIQQTVDLPCSFVDLTEVYSDTTQLNARKSDQCRMDKIKGWLENNSTNHQSAMSA